MHQNQLQNSPAGDEPRRDSLLEDIRDIVRANGFGMAREVFALPGYR